MVGLTKPVRRSGPGMPPRRFELMACQLLSVTFYDDQRNEI